MRKTPYTGQFYEARVDSLKSARVIVPLVLELIRPRSVVDIGCGTGAFLSIFKEKGIEDILGIDGQWVNKEKLCISEKFFHPANLEMPLKIKRTFDLAVSLEVAEHLSERFAKTFIENLTNLAPVILFSAAIPFQGGVHHVNEQWPRYWIKLFKDMGYVPIDSIRKKIWNNKDVSCWYAQNILLFVKKDHLENTMLLKKAFDKTEESVLSLVHPEIYLPKAKTYTVIAKIIPRPIKWIISKFT